MVRSRPQHVLIIGATVALLLVGAVSSLPVSADAPTPLACDTQSVENALAAGGSYVFSCSGAHTIAVPGPATPFVLDGKTASLSGGNADISFDGGGTTRVFEVRNGGALTLTGVAVRHGAATGVAGTPGADAAPGAAGAAGANGAYSVGGAPATAGQPGQPGQPAAAPAQAGTDAGGPGRGGGIFIDATSTATLASVVLSDNVARGGAG